MAERVEIYVDETGHSAEGEIFALAGLGGTSRQWAGFAEEWNAVLRRAGLAEPFHAVEFEGARKQFEEFRQRRDEWRAIHNALTDVIIGHKLMMMGSVVVLEAWRQMDEEARRKNDAYFLATEAMVSAVARDGELTTGGDLELAFYFEKRKDTAAAAERMFEAIRAHPMVAKRERLTSFEFGDKEWPQLQAADLVAYEVRKRVLAIKDGDTSIRWQGEKLLPHLGIGFVTFEAKEDPDEEG
jgi:hypothetical protein